MIVPVNGKVFSSAGKLQSCTIILTQYMQSVNKKCADERNKMSNLNGAALVCVEIFDFVIKSIKGRLRKADVG